VVTAASLPAELTEFAEQVAGRLRVLADGLPVPLRSPVTALAGRPAKRLRSMLLGACARVGTSDPKRVVQLGALVELLHLASLLHDDVVDRAATRRGGPAAHTEVGPERAVLAGLACFALAGMEAASVGEGLDQLVSSTVTGLAYGELLDVERAFDTALSLPDYLELAERKTGDLFRLSCLLGAAEAGAGPDLALALGQFGIDFGVAFQILDDCLDFRADAEGKPTGIDHMMGLFGAPTLCALATDGSGELAALLLSPRFSERDMPAVRALVTATGGLAAATRLAEERYERALAALDGLTPPGARHVLVATAEIAWRGRR
jgi:geranylgeranyl pyrophosphate synthase